MRLPNNRINIFLSLAGLLSGCVASAALQYALSRNLDLRGSQGDLFISPDGKLSFARSNWDGRSYTRIYKTWITTAGNTRHELDSWIINYVNTNPMSLDDCYVFIGSGFPLIATYRAVNLKSIDRSIKPIDNGLVAHIDIVTMSSNCLIFAISFWCLSAFGVVVHHHFQQKRHLHNVRQGLCPQCGYDCHLATRCPECGADLSESHSSRTLGAIRKPHSR